MSSSYDALDPKQLYQLVGDAVRELEPSRAQVAAWSRVRDAMRGHQAELKRLRDQLAAKWPPEQNAAAAAYLRELDRLTEAVGEASLSAASHVTHVNRVADEIEQTVGRLKPIYDEYVQNEQLLAQHEQKLNGYGRTGALLGGPLAGIVTKGAADLVLDSPVADGRQEELAQQARARMTPVTDTVRDAVNNMQPPPQYQPPVVDPDKGGGQRLGGASDGGAVRPPAIAPPAHTQAGTGGGSGAAAETATPSVGVGPGNVSSVGDGADGVRGPGLDAVLTPAPPAVRPPDILPPVVPPGDGTPIGGLPHVPPGPSPTTSFGTAPRVTGPFAGGTGRSLGPGATGGSAVVPGVIGAPGAGTAGGRVGATPPGRVNPIGGVIGGTGNPRVGPASTGARPGAGMMPTGQMGMPGVNGRRPEPAVEEGSERRWDPDNPWETAEGVSPVIEADPISRIDPGPGILGMDR